MLLRSLLNQNPLSLHYRTGQLNISFIFPFAESRSRFHQTYTSGVPPKPDSVLINGKGRYVGGRPTPLAIVNVRRGLRYRFRIISMACEPSFNFAIDGHTMRVIEADGEYTEVSSPVDNIQIHAGQRYSVVVKADQKVGNYWIRSNPDERGTPGFDNNRNLAILRYDGAPNADPTTTSTANKPLIETDLHALNNPRAPRNSEGGVDVPLNLVTGVDFKTFQFTMNGVAFVPPTAPVLLQILNGTQKAQDLLPKGSVYSLPPNSVIEISLPGTDGEIGGPVSVVFH
jgi:iron transport multicopper oxidase